MEKRLMNLHSELASSVGAALEARTKERTESLARIVANRREEEVEKISAVLVELRERILKELAAEPDPQLRLFDEDERDQLERNRDFLRARAGEIPAEIEREAEVLRQRFADPKPRVFPVAVEYRVPRSLDRP
jgi:hypothetical protein